MSDEKLSAMGRASRLVDQLNHAPARSISIATAALQAAADEARADEREKWAKWYESRVGLSAYTAVNDSYAAQAKRLRANQGDE